MKKDITKTYGLYIYLHLLFSFLHLFTKLELQSDFKCHYSGIQASNNHLSGTPVTTNISWHNAVYPVTGGELGQHLKGEGSITSDCQETIRIEDITSLINLSTSHESEYVYNIYL